MYRHEALAHAGIIGTRRATTHHNALADVVNPGAEPFVSVSSTIAVSEAVRLTAGLGLSLWLVERFADRSSATSPR